MSFFVVVAVTLVEGKSLKSSGHENQTLQK